MNYQLPPLKWTPSPNYSERLPGTKIDVIVIHDCEGGYEGAIATFQGRARQVSAHFVLREDGGEATQMVPLLSKAWHACAENSRSIGIEMAGFEAKGYAVAEWTEAATMTAYLCHRFGIPITWSQQGHVPGICRHLDLGAAGGGHVDPTQDLVTWTRFLDMVEEASRNAAWPAEPWGHDRAGQSRPQAPSALPTSSSGTGAMPKPTPLDIGDIPGLQRALNRLGARPVLAVDGKDGSYTAEAIMDFQEQHSLSMDGLAGPQTVAAINAALAKLSA